ncbi:MAG: hypothetical protein WD009_05595 [Phycisphaeraceae bacterium]
MLKAIKQLDDILRGEATQPDLLKQGRIDIPISGLLLVITALGIFYGACMGAFSVIRTGGGLWMQLVASAVKLPLLFFLTLLVTLPSLYVFNALVGSRLSFGSVLRLLIAMVGVALAVLASLGPIVVFFSVSTTSYPFMMLLNVVMAAVAGFLGLAFLLRTLHRLVRVQGELARENADAASDDKREQPADASSPAVGPGDSDTQMQAKLPSLGDEPARPGQGAATPPRTFSGALERDEVETDRRARMVFQLWVVVFALVGAQMSWVLRPFIGSPDMPFTWFRDREGNFFLRVLQAVRELLGITGG